MKLNCNNQNLIDNLPNGIEELELSESFFLPLNNLPSSIKSIKFTYNHYYSEELNCLPTFLEYLELPVNYNKKIQSIPIGLKKIICPSDYEYIEDFVNCEILTFEKIDFYM